MQVDQAPAGPRVAERVTVARRIKADPAFDDGAAGRGIVKRECIVVRAVGDALRGPGLDRASVGEVLQRFAEIGLRRRDVRRSEEHTSELQSLMRISYAVFCLKKKKK